LPRQWTKGVSWMLGGLRNVRAAFAREQPTA
jgi:hypothetical protein